MTVLGLILGAVSERDGDVVVMGMVLCSMWEWQWRDREGGGELSV